MTRPGETILLVDDEETVRRFSARVLEKHGFGVLSARTGLEAIAAAEEHRLGIHLLLTDVMMPGMNGCQLAEMLLARRPSLRVLFMSGYAEDVLVSNVGFVPGAAFLGKPFKPKALVTRYVKSWMPRPRPTPGATVRSRSVSRSVGARRKWSGSP
jgi:two-component system, cell cycle sensor histidine kinase and response regulator CckA